MFSALDGIRENISCVNVVSLVVLHTGRWKLDMSNAVMHTDVALAQHEISPVFALSNVSADRNALSARKAMVTFEYPRCELICRGQLRCQA